MVVQQSRMPANLILYSPQETAYQGNMLICFSDNN